MYPTSRVQISATPPVIPLTFLGKNGEILFWFFENFAAIIGLSCILGESLFLVS